MVAAGAALSASKVCSRQSYRHAGSLEHSSFDGRRYALVSIGERFQYASMVCAGRQPEMPFERVAGD
jgi:hypothetical protein